MTNPTLTAIEGFRVGQAQDTETMLKGCTVILCPPNTVGGVDQRGGAPGTRETDLLRPMHIVQHVHAVFLSGGSAYGLAVADGIMRFLEEQGIGYPTQAGIVPIVAGAILYDLDMGAAHLRPNAEMGYQAAASATSDPVLQGTVGAGTGAKVGNILGKAHAHKGGIGSALIELENGLQVAALIAVNALGDVLDEGGQILAGVHAEDFLGTMNLLKQMADQPPAASNTVIGVVASNAILSKEDVNKMAQMAQDGLARAVYPAHTPFDGDTIFALASGQVPANVGLVGALAADATAMAIREAVRQATPLDGVAAIS